jgi:uncharacterized protein YegL/ribosomal protein L40E
VNLSENTKINIIRGSALALVILFFFAPLVRTSLQLQADGYIHTISGWQFATLGIYESYVPGENRPLVFTLLLLPVALFVLSWIKKSYEILSTIAIVGFVASIIFMFWVGSLEAYIRNVIVFHGFTWLMLAAYAGLSVFLLYCVRLKGKAPIQAVGGVLKTAANSIVTFASTAASPGINCPKCGAILDTDSTFCKKCGQKIQVHIPSTTTGASPGSSLQSSLICSNCNSIVEPDDKFCERCGYEVNKVNSPLPVAQTQAPYTPPKKQITGQTRMPLLLLIDTSVSSSSFTTKLNSDINNFISNLGQDVQTKSMLDIAIIQFDNDVQVLQQYSPTTDLKPIRLVSGGQSTYSNPIREALRMTEEYTISNTEIYKPWIVLISGSIPTDNIDAVAGEIKKMQEIDKLRFMALGVKGRNSAVLKQLTDVVFRLDGIDFTSFFDWVSKCMWVISQTAPNEKPKLPPLEGDTYRDK